MDNIQPYVQTIYFEAINIIQSLSSLLLHDQLDTVIEASTKDLPELVDVCLYFDDRHSQFCNDDSKYECDKNRCISFTYQLQFSRFQVDCSISE